MKSYNSGLTIRTRLLLVAIAASVAMLVVASGVATGTSLFALCGGLMLGVLGLALWLGRDGAVERVAPDETAGLPQPEPIRSAVPEPDLERQRAMEAAPKGALEHLGNFEAVIGGIVDRVLAASGELAGAARSLTHSAGSTQQLSGMVAVSSELTSSNVQTVASTCDHMAATVNEITKQVHASSTIAGEAASQANSTTACVAQLSQSAERIGDVVNLINTIASQTNLLALNATIEAAHAGEAGRGFAVVAAEVKALATQTAKATSDISAQISAMQTATREAVTAIGAITQTIGRMSQIAGVIAKAVEQQDASTKEISKSAEEAAEGSADVASAIQDITKSTTETGAAAARVQSSARALSTESAQLKAELANFLAKVRAA